MYFMPYKFTFDLSRIPRFFFTEIAKVSYQKGVHKKVGRTAQEMIKKFKIQETTGLNLSDAVLLLEDLIEMQARNLLEREKFVQTRKRALFLPHCSRKYMDSRCKAVLTRIFHLIFVRTVRQIAQLIGRFPLPKKKVMTFISCLAVLVFLKF